MDARSKICCDEERILHQLTQAHRLGYAVIDRDLKLVAANQVLSEILDLPEELTRPGTPADDLVRRFAEQGGYGEGNMEEQVADRLAQAQSFEPMEAEWERSDGRIFRIRGHSLLGDYYLASYEEVTVERETENFVAQTLVDLEVRVQDRTRQLKSNRDMFYNALAAISDGVAIMAPDGKVMMANERLRVIYPGIDQILEEGGTIGALIRTRFPDEPDHSVDELCGGDQTLVERRFPDGVWYSIKRSRTPDGGMICVYTDITKYKLQHKLLQRHADELIKHLRKEKQMSEMQREFVSMASHEFRTPLAIIDSNAQRMARKAEKIAPDDVSTRVDRIREAVERMQFLIDRFMNFSQAQSGKGLQVEMAEEELAPLVQDVCQKHQQLSENHRFNIDLSALPQTAEIDRKLIEQSLSNILSNAVKYSPDGGDIDVHGEQDGSFAVIRVRDHGVGIPEPEVEKIFNRFFRASTSSGIPGTGIGLNMTKMIMDQHRGRIDVVSKEGKGTCVSLLLRLQQGRRAPAGRSGAVGNQIEGGRGPL